MPVYRLKCQSCEQSWDLFLKMSEYDNLPACECGGKPVRQICAPAVIGDISPYVSPGTGKLIDSRAKQAEDLRVSNSFIKEPGVEKDIARNREYVAEKAFAPIAKGVDAAVRNLVNAGKIES